MKPINSFVLVMTFITTSFTSAGAGTDIQNGGGGVITRNDTVTTFFDALPAKAVLKNSDVPSLNELKNEVKNLFIPLELKNRLLELISPIHDKYYSSDEKDIPSKTIDEIKSIYAKMMNLPVSQITLFAITNSVDQKTVLLPNFYKLNIKQQMAILFHEALWLMKSKITYQLVVQLEKDFQAFLTNKNYENCNQFHSQFLNAFDSTRFIKSAFVSCAFRKDSSNGNISLNDFLSEKESDLLIRYFFESYFNRFTVEGTKTVERDELIESLNINHSSNSLVNNQRLQLAAFLENMNSYLVEITYPGVNNITKDQSKLDRLADVVKKSKINIADKKVRGYFFQLISEGAVVLEAPINW